MLVYSGLPVVQMAPDGSISGTLFMAMRQCIHVHGTNQTNMDSFKHLFYSCFGELYHRIVALPKDKKWT